MVLAEIARVSFFQAIHMFISRYSTISLQKSFRNAGYSNNLERIGEGTEIKTPDYSEFIPALVRRRMGPLLRMSVTTALETVKGRENDVDAIIVGTGLGMGNSTVEFINVVRESKGGLISPTAFTVCTANTIAGQISLLLKKRCYNITHSQNSLTLEHCLIDAKLCMLEEKENVLLGVADENEQRIFNMHERLGVKNEWLGEGAAFFFLHSGRDENSCAEIKEVSVHHGHTDFLIQLNAFLDRCNLQPSDIDQVLFASTEKSKVSMITQQFGEAKCLNYLHYAGHFLCSNGIALDIALDGRKGKVLIVNNLIKENLGFTYLETSLR